MGDPVDVSYGVGLYRHIDARIQLPKGEFDLVRSFENSGYMWDSSGYYPTSVEGLPTPYGSLQGPDTGYLTAYWWNNLFTVASQFPSDIEICRFGASDQCANNIVVVVNDAHVSAFYDCEPSPGTACWAPLVTAMGGDRTRLEMSKDANGGEQLTYYGADQKRYVLGRAMVAASASCSAGYNRTYYFPEEVDSSDGTLEYTLSYALPFPDCPTGNPGANNPPPYLDVVTFEGGQRLKFEYAELPGDDGNQCVVRSINLVDPSGFEYPEMAYTYTSNGTGEAAGLLASATPGDAGAPGQFNVEAETFSYGATPADMFSVSLGGTVISQQTRTNYPDGGFTISDTSLWSNQSINFNVVSDSSATITSNGVGTGDDSTNNGSASLTEANHSSFHSDTFHGIIPDSRTVTSCTAAHACPVNAQAQSLMSLSNTDCWGGSSIGGLTASEDLNENWSVYTRDQTSNDGGSLTLTEVTQVDEGASSSSDVDPLRTTNYSYFYDSSGRQYVASKTEASAVSGQPTTTFYKRDTSGKLLSAIQAGYGNTYGAAGPNVLQQEYIGTFYVYSHACSGFNDADPDGRVLEVHGPCAVTCTSPTDCSNVTDCPSGSSTSVTQYWYYDAGDGGSLAKKLQRVVRFVGAAPNACSTATALTTRYDAYDAWGHPTTVTDVDNNVTATYTYSAAGDVLSQTVGSLPTERYYYDNGELTAASHSPNSSTTWYTVYCYRDGTSSCTGTWMGRLHWKAKSPNLNGSSPWEKVVYSYWPDGSLKQESFQDGSGEIRSVVTHADDSLGRPTFKRWGDNSQGGSTFTESRLFDGVGNAIGVGMPFNGGPALCGGASNGAPVDPRCAALSYDRLDRLTALAMPNGGATECLNWSDDKHVSVQLNCYGGQANCGGCTQPAATYTFDDFGNLASAKLPWTQDWAGQEGTVDYVYNPMGEETYVFQPSTQYGDGGYSQGMKYTYDTLGRETSAATWCTSGHGGSCSGDTPLYSKVYDAPSTVPAGCPTAVTARSYGRVYSQADTFGTTYYEYDVRGNVTAELRDRDGSGCGATNSHAHPNTFYTYDDDSNVVYVDYPSSANGQQVMVYYSYGYGVAPDRPDGIQAYLFDGTAWAWHYILGFAKWEPFGGLRGYQLETSPVGAVEYVKAGDPSGALPSSCPIAYPTGAASRTGLVQSLIVSDGSFQPGSPGTPVFSQQYGYNTDQLTGVATCLGSAATSPQVQTFNYDSALRLITATGGLGTTRGGPISARQYHYDDANNAPWRKSVDIDSSYSETTSFGGALGWLSIVSSTKAGSAWAYHYNYWLDGNVNQKHSANDSSGQPAVTYVMNEGPSGTADGAADTTVYRSIAVNAGTYSYFYDAKMRRRAKQYPSLIVDEYFYGGGNELLVDQGNSSYSSPGYYTQDDYIWLGGRPVSIVREKLDTSWNRQSDFATGCGRMGDVGNCGIYYPVTDPLGKPVVMLDSAQRIVGTGEYDPFGQVNRVRVDDETPHPYTSAVADFGDFQQSVLGNTTTQMRVKFQAVDTLNGCGGSDSLNVVDSTGTVLTSLNGLHQGTEWTGWLAPTNGAAHVSLTLGYNGQWGCSRWCFNGISMYCCGGMTCISGQTNSTGIGGIVDGYEYRRYDAADGAVPFWTPLRFPGQYHDEESDLNQNWNRFYDPMIGRYLEPEPLLTEDPNSGIDQFLAGTTVTVYGYAGNNPIGFVDRDGRTSVAVWRHAVQVTADAAEDAAENEGGKGLVGDLAGPLSPFIPPYSSTAADDGLAIPASFPDGQQHLDRPADSTPKVPSSCSMSKGPSGPRTGERGRAAKPDGTPKPGKHAKVDPQTGRWKVKDANGKWHLKPPGWSPKR